MPFQTILSELVDGLEGALGAMFLDWEGEAVEIIGRDSSRYDLQLVGAYQGIFLDRLRRISQNCRLGVPQSFRVRLERSVFLNSVVNHDYYLVLVIRPDTLEPMAWERLRKARERLLEEI